MGEVKCVYLLFQAVVAERLDRITGAHERFEKADLERRADGQSVEPLQQLLHFGAGG